MSDSTHHYLITVTAYMFLFFAVAVGVIDLQATLGRYPGPTVSSTIWSWSRAYPVIPFAMGFILGHLFFPLSQ